MEAHIYQNSLLLDGYNHFLDSRQYTYSIDNVLKNSKLGLLMVFFITVMLFFVTMRYLITVLIIPVPMLIGSYMGIINIPINYAFIIMILALFISVILKKSD